MYLRGLGKSTKTNSFNKDNSIYEKSLRRAFCRCTGPAPTRIIDGVRELYLHPFSTVVQRLKSLTKTAKIASMRIVLTKNQDWPARKETVNPVREKTFTFEPSSICFLDPLIFDFYCACTGLSK